MVHESFKVTGDQGNGFRASKSGSKAKTDKDFRKVLAKKEEEGRRYSEEKEKVEGEEGAKGKEEFEEVVARLEEWDKSPKKTGLSLFDLAGTATASEVEEVSVTDETAAISEFTEEVQNESLSALFKGYGSKEKLKAIQDSVGNETLTSDKSQPRMREPMQDLAPLARQQPITPKEKGRVSATFAQEPSDLTAINPMAGVSSPSQPTAIQSPAQQESIAQQMKEIVDQIIDKLYTLNTSGRTDTVIKLRHPPLFAGAGIVISSFDSAKGEFNIAFENLTQAAKRMLDMQENRDALKFALDQKGFTVHIITTTTLTETLAFAQGKAPPQEREEKREGQPRENQEDEEKEQA